MHTDIYLLSLSLLLYIMVVIVIILLFRKNHAKKEEVKPVADKTRTIDAKPAGSSFKQLLDTADTVAGQIHKAENGLEQLKFDLQDFSAVNWNQMKTAESKYYKLADNVLLLLDYLEDFTKQAAKSEETEWIYQKTLRIIHDENISEMPVRTGDKFDAKYHKNVDNRASKMSAGTIVEIVRKGYYAKNQGGKEIVLRHAEVVVSAGFDT